MAQSKKTFTIKNQHIGNLSLEKKFTPEKINRIKYSKMGRIPSPGILSFVNEI